MQHGMHNSMDLQRVEMELRNSALKYHYLVVENRLRNRQPGWLSNLTASFRSLFAPRPVLREERGI
jgi:hypothetical protein